MKTTEGSATKRWTFRRGILPLGLLVTGYFAVLLLLDARTTCVFKNTTGLPCPGCGMTRSWLHVFHFEWAAAFADHPLWPLAMGIGAMALYEGSRRWVLKKRPTWVTRLFYSNLFWGIILAGVVGTYVVRMILMFPSTPPMNYEEHSLLGGLINGFKKLLTSGFQL